MSSSTPTKTPAAVAAAPASPGGDDGRHINRQPQHFGSSPASRSVPVDIAGHTSLHRAIYSISRQSNRSPSPSDSSSNNPHQPTPKQIIDQLLGTPDGYHATKVQCRQGGWTPLHLSCRSVVVPDEVIIALAECDPNAIAIQDDGGENVLHLACRYGMSDLVLESLVSLSPPSAFLAKDDAEGDTPLHAAINHGSTPSILKMLIDANPPSVRESNRDKQTAIHLATDYERHDVISLAVESVATETNASTCMGYISQQDKFGSTPITSLWSSYVEAFGGSIEDAECTWFDGTDMKEGLEQRDTWASLVRMIVTAFCGARVDDVDDRQLLVRAAIGMGADAIPASLLQYIVMRYPSALVSTSKDGKLPLHEAILVSSSHHNLVKTVHAYHLGDKDMPQDNSRREKECVSGRSEEAKISFEESKEHSEDDNSSCSGSCDEIHDILQEISPTPLHILLDAYPKAATLRDNNGRLPLHLAIDACVSWEDGLGKLFDAAPQSLRIPDPKSGLMPFMLAATASEEEDMSACDTIFQLLRLGPDLIASGIPGREGEEQKHQHEDTDAPTANGQRKRVLPKLSSGLESSQAHVHKKARVSA